MTTIWTITENGQKFVVRLALSLLTRKHEIYVNDVLAARSGRDYFFGSMNLLDLGGKQAVLLALICKTIPKFYLVIDGQPVPSDREAARGQTADSHRWPAELRRLLTWLELAKRLNLTFLPIYNASFHVAFNVVGKVQGYFVQVSNMMMDNRQYLVALMVKHGEPFDETKAANLHTDPRISHFGGRFGWQTLENFHVNPRFTYVTIPEKKLSSIELEEKLKQLIQVVESYARPLPDGQCENTACQSPTGSPRRLVILRNTVIILCDACIAQFPAEMEKERLEYEKQPHRFGGGVIISLAVAMLSVLLLAFFISLPKSFAALAVFIIPALAALASVQLIARAGLPDRFSNKVVAAIMSALTIGPGILLGTMIRTHTSLAEILQSQLTTAQKEIFCRMIVAASILTFIYALFLVIGILEARKQYRAEYKHQFQPDIQVIPGEY